MRSKPVALLIVYDPNSSPLSAASLYRFLKEHGLTQKQLPLSNRKTSNRRQSKRFAARLVSPPLHKVV